MNENLYKFSKPLMTTKPLIESLIEPSPISLIQFRIIIFVLKEISFQNYFLHFGYAIYRNLLTYTKFFFVFAIYKDLLTYT